MKTFKFIWALACILSLTSISHGAAAYFGTTTATNDMHGSTNYFMIVQGDGTNSPNRKISPTNTLQMLKSLSNWVDPLTASNALYVIETTRNAAVSNAAIAFSMVVSNAVYGSGGSGNSGTNIQVGRTLYVDSVFGTNSTAIRENQLRPFSTIDAALRVLTNGDKLIIRGGNYTNNATGDIPWTDWNARTNAPLVVASKTNIVIEGDGNVNVYSTNFGNIMRISAVDGFRMSGINFYGSGTNRNQPTLVWSNIFGLVNIFSARSLTVTNGSGTNSNVTIENCGFFNSGDHGILGFPDVQTFGFSILNNKFDTGGDNNPWFAPSDGAAIASIGTRGVIKGNKINNWNMGVEIENTYASPSGEMSSIVIADNPMTDIWRYGVAWWENGQTVYENLAVIVNNSIRMTTTLMSSVDTGTGIQVSANGSGVLVANNTISAPNGAGIALQPSGADLRDVVVEGNIITDSAEYGIALAGGSWGLIGSTINGNSVSGGSSGPTDFSGIYISAASGTKVINNYIHDFPAGGAAGHGVWIQSGTQFPTNNYISGNTFFSLGGTNIVIDALVTNTVVGLNYNIGGTKTLNNSGVGTTFTTPWDTGFLPLVTGTPTGSKFVRDDGVLAVPSGGSGGTNYPPVIRIGTNVTVASGVRQSLTLQTNASFALVFTGTPLNGEEIQVGVSNIAASTIYLTNTAGIFDYSVASNVTTFPIAGTSVRWFTFVNSTNFNLGVARWELRSSFGKESELAVAGQSLVLQTNAAGSVITMSNAWSGAVQTVTGAGSGSTNYLLTLSTNSINDFYLGSSNVHIYTVTGGAVGFPIYWNAYITNLSANTWGINFSSGTNKWMFMPSVFGSNAPSVLSTNTMLILSGRSDGTNTIVGASFTSPVR